MKFSLPIIHFQRPYISCKKTFKFNPFRLSIVFHTETSHLIYTVNQITGFYMKCNTGLKWVNYQIDWLTVLMLSLVFIRFAYVLNSQWTKGSESPFIFDLPPTPTPPPPRIFEIFLIPQ